MEEYPLLTPQTPPPPEPGNLPPAPAPAPRKRSRMGRILLWVGSTLLGLLLLVIVAIAGVLHYASTPEGSKVLLEQVIKITNGAIPGRLTVESLQVDFRSGLHLKGIILATPAGDPVIQIGEIALQYRLEALRKRTLWIDLLRIDSPVITLITDTKGVSNLDQVLGPSSDEEPGEPWDGKLPLEILADRLEIRAGKVLIRDDRNPEPVSFSTQDLVLTAGYRYQAGQHRVSIHGLDQTLVMPELGKASLRFQAAYAIQEGEASLWLQDLEAYAPGLELTTSARVQRLNNPNGAGTLDISVSPELLKRFVPDLQLEGDLTLSLQASRIDGQPLVLTSSLLLPTGDITLTGELDGAGLVSLQEAPEADVLLELPSGQAPEPDDDPPAGAAPNSFLETLEYNLTLTVRDVDVFSLLPPKSRPDTTLSPLSFTADVLGQGIDPNTLHVQVELALDALRYDIWEVQDAQLTARLDAGIATLEQAMVTTPYGLITGVGRLDTTRTHSAKALSAQVTADIADLEPLGKVLEQEFQGSLKALAQLTGSLDAPEIAYQFEGMALNYGPRATPTAHIDTVTGNGLVQFVQDAKGALSPVVSAAATGVGIGTSTAILKGFSLTAAYQGGGTAKDSATGTTLLSSTAALKLEAHDLQDKPVQLDATMTLGTPQVISVNQLNLPLGEHAWTLEAPFDVTLADDITISPFTLAGPGGKLEGKGTYSTKGQNDLTLAAQGVQLASFSTLLPKSAAGLHGKVDLDARITGAASRPTLDARLVMQEVGTTPPLTISGSVALKGDAAQSGATLETKLTLQDGTPTGTGSLEGQLQLPIQLRLDAAPDMLKTAPLAGTLALRDLDLAMVTRASGTDMKTLTGKLAADLTLAGTLEDPRIDLATNSQGMTISNADTLNLDMQLGFRDQRLTLTGTLVNPARGGQAGPASSAQAGTASAMALPPQPFLSLSLELPVEVTSDLETTIGWQKPLKGQMLLDAPDVRVLSPLLSGLVVEDMNRLSGAGKLDLRISGTLEAPLLSSVMRVRQLKEQVEPSFDLDLDFTYADDRAVMLARAQALGEPPMLAEARLRLPLSALLRGEDAPLSHLRAAIEIPHLSLLSLPPSLRGQSLQGGVLSLRAQLESAGATPSITANASILKLAVNDRQTHDLSIEGQYDGKRLHVNTRVTTPDAGPAPILKSRPGKARTQPEVVADAPASQRLEERLEAQIEGQLPLELKLPLQGAAYAMKVGSGLKLKADIPGLDLSILNAFLTGDDTIEGTLKGEMLTSGSLDAPHIEGTMALADGRYYAPSDGIYYDRIRLTSRFTEQKFTVDEVVLNGGNGTAIVKGALTMQGMAPGPLDFTAQFNQFEAINGPPGKILVNGNLQIAGTTSLPDITGKLTIPSAVIVIPDLTGTVVKEVSGLEPAVELAPTLLPPTVSVWTPEGIVSWTQFETGQKVEEDKPSSLRTNILVQMPRNVWIQNDAGEVSIELKGDIRYITDARGDRIEGTVETVRGEIRLFSEPLTIDEGLIIFTGNQDLNPRLDITASSNMGKYGTVTLKVQGTLDVPELIFSSDQGYETADILALLTIGKPLSEGTDPNASMDMQAQLESLAAGALAGVARKQILSKLPVKLDVLTIETSSFSSADLRVGKYITPRLFMVVKQRVGQSTAGQENTTEVRAEYQITPDVYVEAFYGDANIWGSQFFWRRFY